MKKVITTVALLSAALYAGGDIAPVQPVTEPASFAAIGATLAALITAFIGLKR